MHGDVIAPIIVKNQYKLQQAYPVPETISNHWIGESVWKWGQFRHIPAVGEDFVNYLWRWSDCSRERITTVIHRCTALILHCRMRMNIRHVITLRILAGLWFAALSVPSVAQDAMQQRGHEGERTAAASASTTNFAKRRLILWVAALPCPVLASIPRQPRFNSRI